MSFRKLRIVWSVFCGVACVLLIVLWVGSFQRLNTVEICIGSRILRFNAYQNVMYARPSIPSTDDAPFWVWNTGPPTRLSKAHLYPTMGGFGAFVPYAYLVLLTGGLSAGLWIRWRFTVRTLLIATTLVAVVLGLVIILH